MPPAIVPMKEPSQPPRPLLFMVLNYLMKGMGKGDLQGFENEDEHTDNF